MTRARRAVAWVVTISLAALAAALLFVDHRGRNPEWKELQAKGKALAIERLEEHLHSEASAEKRQELLREIASLRTKEPEIIEIHPFGGKLDKERCLTCHFGIEDISASHPNSVFGCVVCHGGNGRELTAKGAHRGLRGGRNPARLDLAAESCGSSRAGVTGCHSQREHTLLNRVDNVPRSLMATNAGIISVLRFQWGLDTESTTRFGIRATSDGKHSLAPIPQEYAAPGHYSLSDSHFRKFCAACHLWSPRPREEMGRLEGCAACHAPYDRGGKYRGGDPTINREEVGHAATHTITNLIPDERCRACHNRSARVGLDYHGEMESSQEGTPFDKGELSDKRLSDDRFVWNLVPDIHHEKGMGCIDCHTGQDTMGDGIVHGFMKDQIEVRCEDCHGGYTVPPATMTVDRNDALVQTLARSSPHLTIKEGDEILKTSKGRPLPHVKRTAQGFRLTGKSTGKEHPVSVITGKPNGHSIKGHERLECDGCHSAWSPQCYGCHQMIDFREKGLDHISGKETPGQWVEGRTHFRFEKNILGINSQGRVGILVPGCQVWNTVVDEKGKVMQPYDSKIMSLKNGQTGIAVGSTHPHTTRTQVPRCIDCHFDPKVLGMGEGRLAWDPRSKRLDLTPIYDSASSGLKISYPIDAVVDADGNQLQSTSHKLARGFSREELSRIVAITPCLPCHDRYDDPVWQRPGPHRETPTCLNALRRMQGEDGK